MNPFLPFTRQDQCFRKWLSPFFYLLIIFVLSGLSFAQQTATVTGTVSDQASGESLVGANIVLVGTFNGASTDANGKFSFTAAPGSYRIRASYIGHGTTEQSVTLTAGETTTIDFLLEESIAEFGETIITVGSRSQRTAVETPVPVDVISELAIRESGMPEVNQVLAELAPSFNASHQTISDGTDHINPASLRGLGPDQVLVLVNGKRRHSSALVHVNGTFGRGSVGVDLNAIPKSAIARIEVLRDGAAAQYGSDAIAGVINIVLKEQTNNIEVNGGFGGYNLLGNSDILEDEFDGETSYLDANFGFKIGDHGYFNVTGNYMNRDRTNRSAAWTGDIFPGISGSDATNQELAARGLTRADFSMKTGMGEAATGGVFFNSSMPIGDNGEFYAFGGASHRNGIATGFFRLPNQEARVDLSLYPNGFLPEIHTEIDDRSITAGLSGIHRGWIVDLSATNGGNAFQYNIENTMNGSLGASSPVSFDAGRLSFNQTTGNLDLVRDLGNMDGALHSLTLALGSEFRVENYQIGAGEDASWQLGNGGNRPGIDFDTTATGAPKDPGSQVFAGFQPDNEVNRYRNSLGLYADLESDITEKFLLAAAARFENYSDFGNTFNWKVSGRFEFAPNFALRGAVSTGFRAPSLHQLWFNNVSIQFLIDPVSGELQPSRVLTSANADPVTRAFGIPQLQEETSTNFSVGFTARPVPSWSITADVYSIAINDRIVLTSQFSSGNGTIGSQIADILAPFANQGVGAAQFFANAVDTRTLGADFVTAYTVPMGANKMTFSLSANVTKTEVDTTNVPAGVANQFAGGNIDAVRTTIFNREERNRLETALPRQKGTLGIRYAAERFAIGVRANYYGEIEYRPTNPANDETFGAKVLLDLDIAYQLMQSLRFSVGANNILNTFPDKHMLDGNISNGRFIYSRRVTQYGMNGGFYYGRFSLTL